MSVVHLAIWYDLEVILTMFKRLSERKQNTISQNSKKKTFSYGHTIQQATRSDRPDPVPGSFREVRTHSTMKKKRQRV